MSDEPRHGILGGVPYSVGGVPVGRLMEEIQEARENAEFIKRLEDLKRDDAAVLEGLKDIECLSARLIESYGGGQVLVYECECGSRLYRTREQAEYGQINAPCHCPRYPEAHHWEMACGWNNERRS